MREAVAEETDENGERILRQMAQGASSPPVVGLAVSHNDGDRRRLRRDRDSAATTKRSRNFARCMKVTGGLGPLNTTKGMPFAYSKRRDAVFDNVNLEWFKERIEDGL